MVVSLPPVRKCAGFSVSLSSSWIISREFSVASIPTNVVWSFFLVHLGVSYYLPQATRSRFDHSLSPNSPAIRPGRNKLPTNSVFRKTLVCLGD